MPAAARAGDPTGHPGVITGPGRTDILIGGQPAVTLGDLHSCGITPPAGPHPPTAVAKGSRSVKFGGRPAARVGDTVGCGAPILSGASDVMVGG